MAREEISEEEAARLVENIERTGDANPEEAKPKGEPADSRLSFDNQDSFMKHQLEYTANGKTIKEDVATILKRASQGYNYAQLSHEQKERQKMLDIQAQKSASTDEKWSKFESYAKENPKWYDHWNTAWQERGNISQGTQPSDNAGGFDDSRLTALLEQKLEPMRDFMTRQQAQSDQMQVREQDQALDQEMKETRAAFPSIDFDSSDPETGKTLQWQVLEFANKRGMGFDDAFKVFYHDKLIATRMEDEKTKWAKDQESNQRKGILGTKPTTGGKPFQADMSKSSWDQVAEYAGKQFGILS